MRKIKWLLISFLLSIFFFSNAFAIEPPPCCPPGTSAVSRAIALKLKEIRSSPEYHRMQQIVFIVVILLIFIMIGIVWNKKRKNN